MKRQYSYEERVTLAGKLEQMGLSINGQKAVVMGYRMDFPVVSTLNSPCIKLEYAWGTLENILNSGQVKLKTGK